MTTQDVAWLVIAGAAVVIALAFASMALSAHRLASDTRDLAGQTDRLLAVLREELPAALGSITELSASTRQLTSDLRPRLERADQLADEVELTLVALREASEAVEQVVHTPADTVAGLRKSAKMVGGGIATSADRLRRVVTRDE